MILANATEEKLTNGTRQRRTKRQINEMKRQRTNARHSRSAEALSELSGVGVGPDLVFDELERVGCPELWGVVELCAGVGGDGGTLELGAGDCSELFGMSGSQKTYDKEPS